MDADKQLRVLEKLKSLGPEAGSRLVLTVERAPESVENIPDPKDFDSGTAYRSAMIERNRKLGETALEGLAQRLRNRSLTVSVGHLSHALVVEGDFDQLADAMTEKEVKDAIPDFSLTASDGKQGNSD